MAVKIRKQIQIINTHSHTENQKKATASRRHSPAALRTARNGDSTRQLITTKYSFSATGVYASARYTLRRRSKYSFLVQA